MSVKVGVTEVQRNFSDYLNRVAYREESFLLIRGGRPVAQLTPVPSGPTLGDLPDLLGSLPPLGPQEARHFTEELGWGRGREQPAPPPGRDGESQGNGEVGGAGEAEGEGESARDGKAEKAVEAARDGKSEEEVEAERDGKSEGEGESARNGVSRMDSEAEAEGEWARNGEAEGNAEAEEAPAPIDADAARPLLLDAVVLLDHQAGKVAIEGRVSDREDTPFHLSVITLGELFRVADRIQNPIRRGVRLAWVEAVAERFPLLPGDLATARNHAELWGRLLDQGVRLGPHDLWLTAACVAHGLILATSDPGRFLALSGLRVENWSPGGREAGKSPD